LGDSLRSFHLLSHLLLLLLLVPVEPDATFSSGMVAL